MGNRNYCPDGPLEDTRKTAEIFDLCEVCGEPIYEGETRYDFGVASVHEDCMRDFVDRQFRVVFV